MKLLFDQGTPVPLRQCLVHHEVSTAYELDWSALSNGDLLDAAEADFDALITTDQNLPYQQNITGRELGILILPTTSWPKIQQHLNEVAAAVDSITMGEFRVLKFSS